MARDLMARELAGALRDFPQRLRLRLPSGAWVELAVAADALPASAALTVDGEDYAADGVSVTVPRDAMPREIGGLIGRAAALDGRRLVVAAVAEVPGDAALTLTLARREVRQ